MQKCCNQDFDLETFELCVVIQSHHKDMVCISVYILKKQEY